MSPSETLSASTHPFTAERLAELAAGYDLDAGGHGFEVWDDVPELPGVVWEDPDPDYVPWVHGSHDTARGSGFARLEAPVYVFVPSETEVDLPESFRRPSLEEAWGQPGCYRLVRSGLLLESERECLCRGGGSDTDPHCPRCGGEGSVVSEGGAWALYVWERLRTFTFPLRLSVTAAGEPPGERTLRSVLEHSTAGEALALGLGLDDTQLRLALDVSAPAATDETGRVACRRCGGDDLDYQDRVWRSYRVLDNAPGVLTVRSGPEDIDDTDHGDCLYCNDCEAEMEVPATTEVVWE